MDRDLTCFGTKSVSFYAPDITDIGFLEIFVDLLTNIVSCNVYLDTSL